MSKTRTTSMGAVINTLDVINENECNEMSFESFLIQFTKKIDDYETRDWKTTNDVHFNLWNDISRLRREINKDTVPLSLFDDWKYKISFELTENSHKNEEQLFKDMSWEESFALGFLYFIYH
jgi:hypothetical protein